MGHLTCGICLSHQDKDDGEVLPALEDGATSQDMLWFKLQFIGFLQPKDRNELPEHICLTCAMRVEDAYNLNLQCLKTKVVWCERSITLPQTDLNSNNILTQSQEFETPPSSVSSEHNHLSGLSESNSIDQGQTSTPVIPTILGSAYDMFTCVQTLSTTLKLNMSLLSNAIHFMENTISLLTVLFPLEDISEAMKKSTESIRSEAESWKIRASMVHDATNFVHQVVSLNFPPSNSKRPIRKDEPDSPEHEPDSPEHTPTLTTTSCNSSCSAVPSSPNHVIAENNLSPKSPAVPVSDLEDVSKDCKSDIIESTRDSNVSSDEVSLVRRSFRSRVSVDHLVYWPSFRKQGTTNNKSANKLRSSKKFVELPRTSSEALDSLLLKRDADSCHQKQRTPVKVEKWSIVPRKKDSDDIQQEPVKKIAVKAEDDKGEHSKSQNSSESSLKECHICQKVLSSNRNLQAHMKMHFGCSPFPCNYCNKGFSSGWNRAQHERVHTGVKPYVCDICQESFRYNVTLRHHKSKRHHVS